MSLYIKDVNVIGEKTQDEVTAPIPDSRAQTFSLHYSHKQGT